MQKGKSQLTAGVNPFRLLAGSKAESMTANLFPCSSSKKTHFEYCIDRFPLKPPAKNTNILLSKWYLTWNSQSFKGVQKRFLSLGT